MTALYFDVLRPQDRVAVKPHASPIFHAIQYLLGKQTRERLEHFRGYKGAQSYPSRTKDTDDVDFSTGSVGLGVAQTLFSSLVQDYVRAHGWGLNRPEGRMVALVGDAELDEGNIFEAILEGWKHGLRNCWWIIDYNRQSLDAVVREGLWERYEALFKNFGWDVVIIKYGSLQQAAFKEPGGEKLKAWIDNCPNQLYSALVFAGGAAWRKRLNDEIGDQGDVSKLIAKRSDEELAALMNNLGGHDLPSVLDAFHAAARSDQPTCFIAYTIKGYGLPFAGHKDNHAGLMTPAQMETFRQAMDVGPGHEWDKFEGLTLPADYLQEFLDHVPFAQGATRRLQAPEIEVPAEVKAPFTAVTSTQTGFGAILNELGRGDSEFTRRIVTTSPDVTVSTNLGAWVNRRGLFAHEAMADVFKSERIPSTFTWEFSPKGQHIELGIAEMNLFILLSAFGLSHAINGERLLPIGTLYDPFIARGLDALNYACYQDARFILVATPSGITLAGEGGAHQSIAEPLDRHGAGRACQLRAGLCRRACRHHGLGFRLHPEKRRRRSLRAQLAARRDRRFGLLAAVDAADRADRAHDDGRTAPADRRRRLLAAQAGAECASDRRLYRRHCAGSHRSRRPDGGGPPRRRAARRHLGRPAQCRLDRGAARARTRAGACALAYRAACSPMCRRIAASSACSTAIRRRSPGSARSPAIARARSASSISARPARSPTSTGTTASTPTPLSPRRRPSRRAGRSAISRHCRKRAQAQAERHRGKAQHDRPNCQSAKRNGDGVSHELRRRRLHQRGQPGVEQIQTVQPHEGQERHRRIDVEDGGDPGGGRRIDRDLHGVVEIALSAKHAGEPVDNESHDKNTGQRERIDDQRPSQADARHSAGSRCIP